MKTPAPPLPMSDSEIAETRGGCREDGEVEGRVQKEATALPAVWSTDCIRMVVRATWTNRNVTNFGVIREGEIVMLQQLKAALNLHPDLRNHVRPSSSAHLTAWPSQKARSRPQIRPGPPVLPPRLLSKTSAPCYCYPFPTRSDHQVEGLLDLSKRSKSEDADMVSFDCRILVCFDSGSLLGLYLGSEGCEDFHGDVLSVRSKGKRMDGVIFGEWRYFVALWGRLKPNTGDCQRASTNRLRNEIRLYRTL